MNPTIMVMTNKNWKESFKPSARFLTTTAFSSSGETFFWLLIFFQLVTHKRWLVQDLVFRHRQCTPYSPYQNLFHLLKRRNRDRNHTFVQSPPSSEKTPITLKTLPLISSSFPTGSPFFDKVTLYHSTDYGYILFFVNIFWRDKSSVE